MNHQSIRRQRVVVSAFALRCKSQIMGITMNDSFDTLLHNLTPDSQIFVDIANYSVFGYLLLLVASILYERKLNSVTITIFVVYISIISAILLTPLFYGLATGKELYHKFMWYGGWIIIDVFCIWLIYYLHKVQKLRATQLSLVVSMSFIAMSLIQAVDFIDRATLQSNFFATAYQVLIATLNTCMLPVILYFWFAEIRKRRLIATGA